MCDVDVINTIVDSSRCMGSTNNINIVNNCFNNKIHDTNTIDNWLSLWKTGISWYNTYPKTNDYYNKELHKQHCDIILSDIESVHALFDGEINVGASILFGKLKNNKYFYYSIATIHNLRYSDYNIDYRYVLFDTKEQMSRHKRYRETVRANQDGIYAFEP